MYPHFLPAIDALNLMGFEITSACIGLKAGAVLISPALGGGVAIDTIYIVDAARWEITNGTVGFGELGYGGKAGKYGGILFGVKVSFKKNYGDPLEAYKNLNFNASISKFAGLGFSIGLGFPDDFWINTCISIGPQAGLAAYSIKEDVLNGAYSR